MGEVSMNLTEAYNEVVRLNTNRFQAAQSATRHNEGKPALSYLLTFPHALEGLAKVCMHGEKKYERFNYLKGAPVQQYVDCLLRHLNAFYNGEDVDPDSGNEHVDHVVWNALMLAETMRWNRDDLDNRPSCKSVIKDYIRGCTVTQWRGPAE